MSEPSPGTNDRVSFSFPHYTNNQRWTFLAACFPFVLLLFFFFSCPCLFHVLFQPTFCFSLALRHSYIIFQKYRGVRQQVQKATACSSIFAEFWDDRSRMGYCFRLGLCSLGSSMPVSLLLASSQVSDKHDSTTEWVTQL